MTKPVDHNTTTLLEVLAKVLAAHPAASRETLWHEFKTALEADEELFNAAVGYGFVVQIKKKLG